MGSDPTPAAFGRHGLGPHVVGQRVVVRRLVPSESGPTGGPAFTDVLGVCERWADGEAVVRRSDGEVVTIPTRLIVSGKPVPPRTSRLARVSREEIDAHLDAPGQVVWLGSLSQLARRFGPTEDADLDATIDTLVCRAGDHTARGVRRGAWLVVEQLDSLDLLGQLLDWAAEEGASTVAFTDPGTVAFAEELDLISR